jgi:hypothetical protein
LNGERAEIPLRLFIMQRIMAENPRTVRDLFQIIKLRRPKSSEEEFINTIRELKESGTLMLEPATLQINSYPAYFKLQDENAWLYLVALLTLSTFLAIYVMPSTYPLIIFRWIIGSMFVLFLPGYVTIQALFPEGKELDSIERLALTIGLSLAITPLIGLLLNYTPWGIRLDPIVAALSMFTLGIGMAGSFRKYRIARKTGKT